MAVSFPDTNTNCTIFRVVNFSPASRESGDEANLGGVCIHSPPESYRQESELALQLLLDRLLKKQLHNEQMQRNKASSQEVYVAVSLLKKYRKPTEHPQLKVKRALFVRILTEMKAVDQPDEPESVLDYTSCGLT